jgi:hypothetical protein
MRGQGVDRKGLSWIPTDLIASVTPVGWLRDRAVGWGSICAHRQPPGGTSPPGLEEEEVDTLFADCLMRTQFLLVIQLSQGRAADGLEHTDCPHSFLCQIDVDGCRLRIMKRHADQAEQIGNCFKGVAEVTVHSYTVGPFRASVCATLLSAVMFRTLCQARPLFDLSLCPQV